MRLSLGFAIVLLVALEPREASSEPAQEREYHPEPRVIVNVLSVQGPHEREAVQRAARNAWGRIVSCYKSVGQRKRGSVELELTISADGRVPSARRSGGSLENPDLAACLAGVMKRVEMPAARARSRALTEIELGPGDAS
ncbi:MAG TPA: hypothetical protein VI072_26240 [Polyangiaceae bacterium]